MRNLLCLLGFGCLIFGVTPAQAEIGHEEEVARVIPGEDATGSADLSDDLDFRRWPEDGFVETVLSRMDALTSAHAGDRAEVMLDLAEIYLAQMLTREAESFVAAAEQAQRQGTSRYFALRDAVNLLRGIPAADFDQSPLNASVRLDVGLWRSLHGLALGDEAALRNNLAHGLTGLSFQSGPVARALLPLIAEAAISAGEDQVSDAALSLLQDVPQYANSTTLQYLEGRHQEDLGNTKSALEAYFDASRGWDSYSARARIALAKLAIEDGSTGALLAARDVLSAGIGAWRGDRIEIQALELQAQVSGLLGEPIDALLAYRRILTRFPDSPEAQSSITSAQKHLDVVYRQGADGDLPLADWFELHQILLPTYRFLPSFPLYNERLADAVLTLGGVHLAISEYRQVLSIYEEWPQMRGIAAQSDVVDRVRLKLSDALSQAGLWHETLQMLDQISSPTDARLVAKISKLRTRALTELGDVNELLRGQVVLTDAENLRHLGRALFVRENWSGAKERYAQLWSDYPDAFRLSDAAYLLIASHRAGDEDLARQVTRAFPGLTESDDIAGLAKSLLEQPAPLTPLDNSAAADRLESAKKTMRLIEQSGL